MKAIIVTLVCIAATVTAAPQLNQNPSGFAPFRTFVDFANGFLTPFNTLTSSVMQGGQAAANAVDQTVFNNGLFNRLGSFNPLSSVSAATNNLLSQSNNAASQLLQSGQNIATNAVGGVTSAGNQIPQAAANVLSQTPNGIGSTSASSSSSTGDNNNTSTQTTPTTTAAATSNANSAPKTP